MKPMDLDSLRRRIEQASSSEEKRRLREEALHEAIESSKDLVEELDKRAEKLKEALRGYREQG